MQIGVVLSIRINWTKTHEHGVIELENVLKHAKYRSVQLNAYRHSVPEALSAVCDRGRLNR